jgi:homoserine dehydrogenase
MTTHVPIVLLGLGTVGRTLVKQMLETRALHRDRYGVELKVVAIADSQALYVNNDGLSAESLEHVVRVKQDGRSLRDVVGDRPSGSLALVLTEDAIVVDVTASTRTEGVLREAVACGCGIVMANKLPLTVDWHMAKGFFAYADLRHEATVGAGLPVISTMRSLLDTGDCVRSLEGCMSGTLGYLCTQIEQGVPYSKAVAQAQASGFTEPDPREDLGGRDVARKALILARLAGWPLEMSDLSIEPLYPQSLTGLTVEAFMTAATSLDDVYRERADAAARKDQVLRYLARVSPEGGAVGLTAVSRQGLLGSLQGPANYFGIYTDRYEQEPVVISGPGAGPEVTAAGVLGDIVDLASRRIR